MYGIEDDLDDLPDTKCEVQYNKSNFASYTIQAQDSMFQKRKTIQYYSGCQK